MKTKRVKLDNLVPDNLNANRGTVRGSAMVEHSIRNYGAGRSILVDAQNRIIAGNKTHAASLEAGLQDAVVVETDGTQLVVVRRSDVSIDSPEGRALAIADNRSAEVGLDWNLDVLSEISEELDLSQFWLEGEIEIPELSLDELDEDDGLTDPEEVPEVEGEVITSRGDVWILGDHRVMCGDSTSADDVARLMCGQKADMVYSDPPYGMHLETDFTHGGKSAKGGVKINKDKSLKGGNSYKRVIGDNEDFSPDLIETVFQCFPYCKEVFLWGADYYAEHLPKKNEGSWIVWDKRVDDSLDQMFGSCFELCWSKKRHRREIARIKWAGVFGVEQEHDRRRSHPTQKPTLLAEWFFDRWGSPGEIVVDLYGGSGSTLIACEKSRRFCFMMEMDPSYCDLIVKRWEEYTGKKAQLESADK